MCKFYANNAPLLIAYFYQWLSVRHHVLMVRSMKMAVIWDVVLCSMVEIDSHSEELYCLHHHHCGGGIKHFWSIGQFPPDYIDLMLEAVSTSETLSYFNHTTWSNVPDNSHCLQWSLYHFLDVVTVLHNRLQNKVPRLLMQSTGRCKHYIT
jgi:hypothetical protein